jgi:hypothetical protein
LLDWSAAANSRQLGLLQRQVAAAAAFGVDAADLVLLMHEMKIEEKACFTLTGGMLDLLTKAELDGLADELGLKARMGERYKTAHIAKHADFVKALLSIKGVEYKGLVPAVMCYPRPAAAPVALVQPSVAEPVAPVASSNDAGADEVAASTSGDVGLVAAADAAGAELALEAQSEALAQGCEQLDAADTAAVAGGEQAAALTRASPIAEPALAP